MNGRNLGGGCLVWCTCDRGQSIGALHSFIEWTRCWSTPLSQLITQSLYRKRHTLADASLECPAKHLCKVAGTQATAANSELAHLCLQVSLPKQACRTAATLSAKVHFTNWSIIPRIRW